jgi:hypothetical protein
MNRNIQVLSFLWQLFFMLSSSGFAQYVVLQMDASISEGHVTSFFKFEMSLMRMQVLRDDAQYNNTKSDRNTLGRVVVVIRI